MEFGPKPSEHAANDNTIKETLNRPESVVVPFTGAQKNLESVPEIDGVRLAALRWYVTQVEADFPFMVNSEAVAHAEHEISQLTFTEIRTLINAIDPSNIPDGRAPFYKALINRLSDEHIDE